MRPSNKYTHRIYIVVEDGKAKKKNVNRNVRLVQACRAGLFCSSDIHVQVRRKFTQEYCFTASASCACLG